MPSLGAPWCSIRGSTTPIASSRPWPRVSSTMAGIGGISAAIQHAIQAAPEIEAYVVALWEALVRPAEAGIRLPDVDMDGLVQGGASPRGVAFLVRAARVRAWLEGRDWLVPEDVRAVFPEVMAHRVFLEPIYEIRRAEIVPALCRAVFETVPAP